MARNKWQATGSRDLKIFSWLLGAGCLMLAACGFHLRGVGGDPLPESLATLNIVPPATGLANDPLLVAVRDALTAYGARIVDTPDAPRLTLYDEATESQVLAVRAQTAKGAAYMLRYRISFRVVAADGTELVAPQTIHTQRDYTFDSARVLAKEEEERELLRALRRDTAEQIVRRLTRASRRDHSE